MEVLLPIPGYTVDIKVEIEKRGKAIVTGEKGILPILKMGGLMRRKNQ
jgi:hypothetical protein